MICPKAIINLSNLRDNLELLQSKSKNADIMPVIKANAYGHGFIQIAKFLHKIGITTVCVATISEIKELLKEKIDINIFHLGRISYDDIGLYQNKKIIATINSIEDINFLNKHKNIIRKIRCHIKIDTGMNRMGVKINEFITLYNIILKNSSIIDLEGIYSHLACSEVQESSNNDKQIKLFQNVIKSLNNDSLSYHLLNSGGLINYPNNSYNFVRIGIAMYGVLPVAGTSFNKLLKPVMEFKAPIVHLKSILKGEKIGYGCTFIAKNDMNIAIVQCGYADGLSMDFENKGVVFYKSNTYSILGRISMDLFVIDTLDYEFKLFDEITIWGGKNKDSKLEHISRKYNSIPYVYLTNLSNRVKRIYIEK